ncbi:site-2 protease family protein [Salinithrix halophila]|uniref:Site-2 protease family protein n=1 Tax=Salinithrix halophila TaxID=1485204 RepID=A0ABV8JC71_9BACL
MFGLDDLDTFTIAFFVVLPLVTFIHELGHLVFARLFGCRKLRLCLGHGRLLVRLGIIELRSLWFWHGFCDREDLPQQRKVAQMFIYLGGPLFNMTSFLLLDKLIKGGMVEPSPFVYQFSYFSFYLLFFALFPMRFPDGTTNDGQAILDLIREWKKMKKAGHSA